MRFKFTIIGRLSGRNESENNARTHWAVAAKKRKEELVWCMASIRHSEGFTESRFRAPVFVSFVWIEPNQRRDPDNIIGAQKVILDALVKVGVLENDTQKEIKQLTHSIGIPDKENPRIEVTMQDWEIFSKGY